MPGCVNTKFKSNAPVQAFAVADEPNAAAIGRNLLNQGGSAADAAAGMALAMAVTLPSRVGLGGGGVCLVFDAETKRVRTLDFLPRPTGPGGTAAPGFVRAIQIMQATSGTLRWEQVAVPAETLARESPGVSRALAQDFQAGASRLSDAEARRIFLPGGRAPAEGTVLAQPELAALLSQVRRTGAGAVYAGSTAQALAGALGIDTTALHGIQPQWRGTVAIDMGTKALHLADLPDAGSGAAQAKAWSAVEKVPAGERAARAGQILGATGSGPGEAPAAGLVAMDSRENAVACAFTMGGLFGTGRVAPGTGVLTATGVNGAGFGAPALLANTIVGRALFGAVGTAAGDDGPAAGSAALLAGALPALLDDRTAADILATRGGPGRVDLVTCQVSMENGLKDCRAAADPRGHGFAHDLLIFPDR
ncbi:MAG TPA: gamma-glutamyltransferase [Azospirillum sp.]|nr:gamma-glutamyltransferase [Azospirillum sp.]